MRALCLILLLSLTSCLTNDSLETRSVADFNIYRLRQLCKGMNEDEVYARMRAPAKQEQVVIGEDEYDIWFYITKGTVIDQNALMRRNLTPVIFKNERLIGMGYTLYDRIIYKASTPVAKPEEQKKDDQENKEIEKTLKQKSDSSKKNQTKISLKEKPASEEKEEENPYLDEEGRRALKNEQDQDFNEP